MGFEDNPSYRAWEYCDGFTARADALTELAAQWAAHDIALYRENGAWERELISRQLLLYKTGVDVGFQLMDLAHCGLLYRLPRIRTRVFQLASELRSAVRLFRVHVSAQSFGPLYSFDRYLALAFEDTCRLWPLPNKRPNNKKWGARYTNNCEVHRATIYAAVLRALSAEVLKAVAGK